MDSKQLDLELSHTAKLNPTAEVFSKSTGPESPSMRTSSNSQQTDSEQMALFQTSSAAAIPASRSQSQVIDEAKRMIDISGRSLFPLLRDSDPLGAFSKMCMGTSRWGSTTYSMIWKAKTTPRGRLFLVLSPSTRSTAGTESGSSQEMWPTPVSSDANGAALNRYMGSETYRHNLKEAVRTSRTDGHLNPEWVEWLMGYPIGHTDLKDCATRSSRKSSRKSEKL